MNKQYSDLNNYYTKCFRLIDCIHFNSENFEKAASCFERAITINPYYYDALFNLRDTYMETGNQVGYLMCINQMKEIKDHGSINV